MSSNDFESCVIRIELFSNIEGDNSGKISGEEILVSGLEGPVIDFMQLLVSFLSELLPAPVDCVVGGDGVVDEF